MAAPDVFHRTGTWLSFGYDQFAETRPHTSALNEDLVVDDMQAALDFLAAQPDVDPTRSGVVGYCFGGRASLVAAIRMPQVIKAAAIFYGGGISGRLAGGAGQSGRRGAGHGFCCDARPSYHPRAAQDAWHRTLGFFGAHLGPVPAVTWE